MTNGKHTALSESARSILRRFADDPDLAGIDPGRDDMAAVQELVKAGVVFAAYHLTAVGEAAVRRMRRK